MLFYNKTAQKFYTHQHKNMPNKKISEFDAISTLDVNNDVFPLVDATDNTTKKSTVKLMTSPRATTIVSDATPTVNTDNCDYVDITALAAAITSMTTNLSGSPVDMQRLIYRIKDDGTARAITWGASFAARGIALPTTTVASKYLLVGFLYNATTSTWDCVAASQEV